ncbi:MAG TPA: GNA1162 family protein, partial [Candidatus Binataceae bacterium]|nr:GNA1162 family protein [Candidatus Binataceae bacterium]
DFAKFRAENPQSILIVPVTNKSVDVNAPDYFLATVSRPLAERGYYVFPVNMVRSVLSDDGLSDANMVHAGDPRRLGELFGADAIMYISIERWDAKYVVLSTTVTVELNYQLKSAHTGEELWSSHQTVVYQPQQSGGAGVAGLVANAIAAAIAKAAPNYMPLARQANHGAIYTKGTGLPAGPHDSLYVKDSGDF